METQVVELTAAQLEALLSEIALYGRACVVSVVVVGFFIAFEFAAFVFWRAVLKE